MNKIALILAAFSLFGCLREKRHAPVNLVLFARLTASGTQPRDEFFEWPREAEDAISTVRDSDSGTGWKAPIGKESSIEIDIQPWIGEIVPLEVLRMKYSGKKPENVRVELLVGCGGVPLGILEWKDVDLDLDLNGRDAGCMKIDLFATEALSITVLELWGGDFDRNYPVPEIMYAEPPVERHKNSGVIEGFYGIPWSWGERIWMMMNMAWNGLDTYVYAPKNDDLHRENWREPYPSNSVWEFGNLNKWAGMFGITFYFGISPFIDFDFSDGGDFETLREKLLTFVNSGIDGIALLADDIEFEVSVTVDGAMALAQADVANRLFDELKKTEPELRMFFVPTVYSDNRMKKWKGGEEYLKALENLRPEIEIMWTGKGTSNKTMAAGDMEKFTSLTGRKPVIWDNFWANDGGDGFMGRILLGPFSGRSADLPGAVNGIAHNPSIQGALSRVALSTFAYYMKDPAGYDPNKAGDYAAGTEALFSFGVSASKERDSELVKYAMSLFEGNAQEVPGFKEMESAIGELKLDDIKAVPIEEAGALLKIFARMRAAASEFHHSGLDTDLVDELVFPLKKIGDGGEAGMLALIVLGEKLAGGDGKEFYGDLDAALERYVKSRFIFSPGKIEDFAEAAKSYAPEDLGFKMVAIKDELPPKCEKGKELVWTPFEQGAEVAVFGLPGAKVEDGAIKWTPQHCGRYEGAAIGINKDTGWNYILFIVACQ